LDQLGYNRTLIIILVTILFFISFESRADQDFQADTTIVIEYPERISSKTSWEKVVSLPGTIINIPFAVLLKTVDFAMGVDFEAPFIVRLVDPLIADDGNRGLIPKYSSRAGVGLKFYQKSLFNEGSKFDISATGGRNRLQRYRFRIRNLEIGQLTSGMIVQYMLMPTESFYGIGMDSEKDDKTIFAWGQAKVEIVLGRKIANKISFNLLFNFERNNIFSGKDDSYLSTIDVYDSALPGLETGIEILSTGIELDYNSTNNHGRPTSGWVFNVKGTYSEQTNDDKYGFYKSSVDITRYIHLFYGRTIAMRLSGGRVEPSSDKDIPFYYQSELGKSETIRGFSRGRFIDRDFMLGSIEYRYPLMPNYLDAFLFSDFGRVSADIFDDLSADKFQVTFGGGIYIWDDDEIKLRMQLGKSKEQLRFYFSLN